MLDNFALLSGHISTLNRLLSSDKMPAFKNYAVIPLALSPERDAELEVFGFIELFLFYVNTFCHIVIKENCPLL